MTRDGHRRLRSLPNKKYIYRHRRILGSLSAALAVLFLFFSLRSTPTAVVAGQSFGNIADGHVAVPVTLRSPGISAAVQVGDLIDLVVATENGIPRVIATTALVMNIPGAGGFSSTNSAVIVVSVPDSQGTALAAETSNDISFVIHQDVQVP